MANSKHGRTNRTRRSNKSNSTNRTRNTSRTKKEEMDRTQRYSSYDAKRDNSNKKSNNKKIDNAETKVLKSTGDLKNKKKKKKQKKHPKLMLALKIFIILTLLIIVALAGIVAAIFFGMFGNDFEIKKEDLVISASNSKIVDQDGNVIADLSGDEKRKIITLDQMAEYLPKAYVAIEDERFYEHDGVDFKRTAGAILGKLFGKGDYGGSTITQQLVKNITKEDDTAGFEGIKRKIKEWAKAYQVEKMISKDQILELYLNILYVGGEGNLHGVELGAEYYFNKSAKDLSLAECSFLAGINSSPNYYNPYKLYGESDTEEKRAERIRNKCLTVLGKMKEVGFIEKEEDYNEAVEQVKAGLTFEKSTTNVTGVYSYHTDALIEQVIAQVMEEKNCTREIAENYIYGSGLTIYSTVDTSIQSTMEEEFANTQRYQITSSATGAEAQSGMAVVDYKTGNVLGVVGGLGTKTEARGLNRATQSLRQTGSVMKPISVIAPGLEEKVIQTSTIYDDSYTAFGTYKPENYNYFRGLVSIREFIKSSQNVPAVKIMAELTPSKSIDYLRKMGVTTLYKSGESDKYNDEGLPLAIGGLSRGISPLEMAVAYGTIANGGESITPTFYTKIEDSNGNVVMTPNQTRQRAMSAQNAYITTSILQEPVSAGGTATYCAIPGMQVAAKTGTTDDYKDRWLCGYTPYYSAACWYGYDEPEHVYFSGNPAGNLWDSVMTRIHDPLPNANFERPDGIVTATVCRATGCLATEGCTDVYDDIFTADNMPPKCEGHDAQEICLESGKLANEYCPEKETQIFGLVVPKEKLGLWTPLNGGATEAAERIEEICDIHKKPEEPTPEETKPTDNKDKDKDKDKEKESGSNTKPKDDDSENNSENGGTSGTGTSTEGGESGDNSGTGENSGGTGDSSGDSSGTAESGGNSGDTGTGTTTNP